MTSIRHLSVLVGCAVLANLPVSAQPATESSESFYVRVSTGAQKRDRASDSAGTTTFKTGNVFDAALGYQFDAHNVEAEVSYFNNRCNTTDPAGPAIGVEPSSGNVDVNALMANYAYDIPLGQSKSTLYIGGGYGLCKVSINGLTTPSLRTLPPEWGGPVVVYAKSNWASAYQLRTGVRFHIRPKMDAILGYRYLSSSTLDINLADGSTIHPKAALHALEIAVRIKL